MIHKESIFTKSNFIHTNFVVVGGGLSGSLIADCLIQQGLSVTVIVHENNNSANIVDIGHPAGMQPHVGNGAGGTTRYWHNGLIIPDLSNLKDFKLTFKELEDYFDQALRKLGNISLDDYLEYKNLGHKKNESVGIPMDLLGNPLYYPINRKNIWDCLNIEGRAQIVRGTCLPLNKSNNSNSIQEVSVSTACGLFKITGDNYIVACGGMGSPVLLANISKNVGFNYSDHPTAFIGDVRVNRPIYSVWNILIPNKKSGIRIPLIINSSHGSIGFYFRPAYHRKSVQRVEVSTLITTIRNNPWDIKNYIKILSKADDIAEIIAIKLGVNISTDTLTVLMSSAQRSSTHQAIGAGAGDTIWRDWRFDDDFITSCETAFNQLISELGPIIKSSNLFPDWMSSVKTASHHSGSVKMGDNKDNSVCDFNGKVHGYNNLYVTDASVIPSGGFENTGLLIAALSLRLGNHLGKKITTPMSNNTTHDPHEYDFVISGCGSFIGKKLIPILTSLGYYCCSINDFKADSKSKYFLHLANVHENPTASLEIIRGFLNTCAGRVKGIILPQTFSSLYGCTSFRKDTFNGGYKPKIISPYVAGKLLQELWCIEKYHSMGFNNLNIVYLPHFIDENSPWSVLISQANLYGYYWGTPPKSDHGVHFVSIKDLSIFLKNLIGKEDLSGIGRSVLTSGESISWVEAMSSAKLIEAPSNSVIKKIKGMLSVTKAYLLGLSLRAGRLELLCKLLWSSQSSIVRRNYKVLSNAVRVETTPKIKYD